MLENSIPKYKKLKEIIKSRILKNEYLQDSQIPSENDFVGEFKVSRQTVLRALTELINEGLIYRKQGKGTFVSKIERELKKRIGIIVYRSDDSYYSKVIRGVESFLFERGFSVALCNSEGCPNKEAEHIDRIIDSVDGFIICPVIDHNSYSAGLKRISDEGIPYVLVSSVISANPLTAISNCVIPDDCMGGFLAGKHLFEAGCENIIFVASRDSLFVDSPSKERLKGLKFALREKGVCFDEEKAIIGLSCNDPDHGYEADAYEATGRVLSLLKKGARTGVFASGDHIAIALLRGLGENNIKVPEEVSICGYDDIELAGQWGIELTTVRQEKVLTGKRAAEMLLKQIQGDGTSKCQHITMPVELIKRRTT
jgi:GntR family transcriptional regulator of arabinose operon